MLTTLSRTRLNLQLVYSTECVDDIIQNKVEVLQLMGSRLGLLTSHDALLLLRHSFAIPKVLYILRTSPCFLSDRLESFDDVLRNMLRNILNVDLALESTWLQASLPVRMGGIIGIRRAVQLAPSAYLASAAGCSELIRLLPSKTNRKKIAGKRKILSGNTVGNTDNNFISIKFNELTSGIFSDYNYTKNRKHCV